MRASSPESAEDCGKSPALQDEMPRPAHVVGHSLCGLCVSAVDWSRWPLALVLL